MPDAAATTEPAPTDSPDTVAASSDDGRAEAAQSDEAAARPKRGRPRKAPGSKPQSVELVLTVSGSVDANDWHADVVHAGKKVVKGLPVPASAVGAAAKDLHPDIAAAIEAVLDAARDRQRSRVEQLQAELDAAQRALADLHA